MKKSDCEKLLKITFDFDEDKSFETLTEILPEGGRYKCGCMGDYGWWYLVKYVDLIENRRKRYFCIVRSWKKTKRRWEYRCIGVVELLYYLHLDNEYI